MYSKNEILILLGKLISIPSISSDNTSCHQIISFCEEYFDVQPLTVKKFVKDNVESLLVYAKKSSTKNFDIILNVHLDVVPASTESFAMRIVGNRAYGRGVFDMKGSAAVIMYIYKHLAISGKLPENVALMIVTDEETGGHKGTKSLLEKHNISCNFFLAGEPTNLNICYEQKGILWLEIKQKGKAAHGSRPWEGKNANSLLAENIHKFYSQISQPQNKNDWKTSYNLSLLNGGTARNIVAGDSVAFMDIRRTNEDTPQMIIKKIKKTFTNSRVITVLDEPILYTKPNNKYIQKLSFAMKKALQKNPKLIKETYGSDGRFYSVKGVAAINFGTAGGGMHSENEWVNIQSLEDYYKILKEFLLSLS